MWPFASAQGLEEALFLGEPVQGLIGDVVARTSAQGGWIHAQSQRVRCALSLGESHFDGGEQVLTKGSQGGIVDLSCCLTGRHMGLGTRREVILHTVQGASEIIVDGFQRVCGETLSE